MCSNYKLNRCKNLIKTLKEKNNDETLNKIVEDLEKHFYYIFINFYFSDEEESNDEFNDESE